MSEFRAWFSQVTGCEHGPHAWQETLALDEGVRDRLIRIPTGFRMTAGTLTAWLWNRVENQNVAWPRRLAICLPMRVLVEQTEAEVRRILERAGCLWNLGNSRG